VPIVVRILEEIFTSAEGSFNWDVIPEPGKPIYHSFLDEWDEPDEQGPAVIVERPHVKQENTKGKGRMDSVSIPDATAPSTRSSRAMKRKMEEEEEEEEDEGEENKEDAKGGDEEDEEEEKEEEKKEKQDVGGKKKGGRVMKKVRIKSAAEVHSEDNEQGAGNDVELLPHPEGVCKGCSNANVPCMISTRSRSACTRCKGRKEKCSLSKKMGESLKKAVSKSVVAGKPPSTGSKSSGSHLLGEKMTVFSNPHLQGTSPIPQKSIGQLSATRGGSEPVVRVMRARPERGESVRAGSVRRGHDQEIPSKSLFQIDENSFNCM
jgi:hypothetical protein